MWVLWNMMPCQLVNSLDDVIKKICMNENKGWVSEKESSMRKRMGVFLSSIIMA
jgi:hypothetical protein